MTKQEVIKNKWIEAVGIDCYKAIEHGIGINGFVGMNIFSIYSSYEKFPSNVLETKDVFCRPISLRGIEKHFSFVPVKGYEGLYEVNENSLLKSLSRVSSQKNGKVYTVSEKILAPQMDRGYLFFGLRKDGKTTKNYLHRIMAEAFIPNPEKKPCVNHINGVKHDNSISNLEWCTYEENNKHAFDTGLQKKGEHHHLYGKKGVYCHNHKKYNRGWVKIESEADLPKLSGRYFVMDKLNGITDCYYNSFEAIDQMYWLNEITHYQPIVKPEPPLF